MWGWWSWSNVLSVHPRITWFYTWSHPSMTLAWNKHDIGTKKHNFCKLIPSNTFQHYVRLMILVQRRFNSEKRWSYQHPSITWFYTWSHPSMTLAWNKHDIGTKKHYFCIMIPLNTFQHYVRLMILVQRLCNSEKRWSYHHPSITWFYTWSHPSMTLAAWNKHDIGTKEHNFCIMIT